MLAILHQGAFSNPPDQVREACKALAEPELQQGFNVERLHCLDIRNQTYW